jgi:hypothetical protein
MELVSLRPIQAWQAVSLPRVDPSGWDPETARTALVELRRLRGELDSAVAVLVGVVSQDAGRDTKATVVRELGVCAAEAGRIVKVANVVSALSGVGEAIASGEYSADHVQRVAKLKTAEDAQQLLAFAATESPDDFEKRIGKFLLDTAGPDRRARQRAERSVKFFTTKNGSKGMRVVVPYLEGELLEANLKLIADEQYKAAHPERAKVAGDHDVDSLEQRLADALIEAVNGDTESPVAGETTEEETSETTDSTRTDKPKKKKKPKKRSGGGRTAVVVTMNLETFEARILGRGSVDTYNALSLLERARTDVYFCVQDANGAIMKFGRDRRFATQMQKLAMAVRQEGLCDVPGCNNMWTQGDAHHDPPFTPISVGDPPGRTDIDAMRLPCRTHHQHEHAA